MKKSYLFLLVIIYIIYNYAILTVNNFLGNILSPILIFIASCSILYGFVIKETNRIYRICGWLYAACVFSWSVCDLIWGISNIVLYANPKENVWLNYGYSITSLCLFLSLIISGYMEVKGLNKIQTLLDTLIISICIMVVLWLFVFDQDIEKASIIKSNLIFMATIIMDVMIFAWTMVWYISTRTKKTSLFVFVSAVGGITFVITDLIYYYQVLYTSYEPNSWLDGTYMLAFVIMGISGYVKAQNIMLPVCAETENRDVKVKNNFNQEIIIFIVPIVIIVFKGGQTYYFLLTIIAISIYLFLTNLIQKTIMQEDLLLLGKKHVYELEAKVEERTKEIVRIMNTDIITGLYNRTYFEANLSKLCDTVDRNECINLFYVDLNKYRSIQALYGRYVGENLLKQIGNTIRDINAELEHPGLLAAFGEDIFVIALKSSIDHDENPQIPQKIINRCSGRYRFDDSDIVVTLNIGVASYPLNTNSYENLVKNADAAMMYARKLGYNRVSYYNEDIGHTIHNRYKIEVKLKKVIYDEEFKLYFQPQVSCNDGRIIGTEALIRWFMKNGKHVPPNEFIPITEESGQIIPLGYWIIEQAAKNLANWRTLSSKELKMAVNVSVKQLSEVDFVPNLKEILQNYNVSPHDFEIEITENIQMEGNTEVRDNLVALSKMGISIAIDDFGTGYSSIYYLKNLPMNRIKIAKELVDNIENDSYSNAIIRMVIEIAKSKGIKVIAEGVETKEQWECLKELHCDEIQGYYFAKPMPEDELINSWIVEK